MSYERDIRPHMREIDQKEMLYWFDLWSYEDVKREADAILERLQDGTMPPDGRWPAERVALFETWMAEGCAP